MMDSMAHPPFGTDPGAALPRESEFGSVVVDKGSFSHAVCRACGWRGPGRRSRRVAGLDASSHVTFCPQGASVD